MGRAICLAVVLLAAVPSAQDELVIAIAGSKEYHRPHCDLVRKGGELLALTVGQANGRGLKPHADCDPSKHPPPGAPAKPVHVFLDDTKYYHREKCSKLGASPKRVTLDEAAKKHWPCRTCKPPIRPRGRSEDQVR
jgi:hypothetical protein